MRKARGRARRAHIFIYVHAYMCIYNMSGIGSSLLDLYLGGRAGEVGALDGTRRHGGKRRKCARCVHAATRGCAMVQQMRRLMLLGERAFAIYEWKGEKEGRERGKGKTVCSKYLCTGCTQNCL